MYTDYVIFCDLEHVIENLKDVFKMHDSISHCFE
ncbi:hypothetical protein CI610_03443 [invertebrate metagenome]|uniref:Uncharacterized protein n=1 Tax=invertebrate metagenome TaxID=1711999 RepID=A0A2H9T324_9ZZZZ